MLKVGLKEIPLPGFRNIKTSLAILILLILYHTVLLRDNVVLAAIAAIICMQDSVEKSITAGINRVIGTVIGGIFGVLVLQLKPLIFSIYLYYVFCACCISLLIYVCFLFQKIESISISCVVFLIIAVNTELYAPLEYSFMRVINTIIGITVAVLVNKFVAPPPPKIENNNLNYKIIRAGEFLGFFKSDLQGIIYNASPDESFDYMFSVVKNRKLKRYEDYNQQVMVISGEINVVKKKNINTKVKQYEKFLINNNCGKLLLNECPECLNMVTSDNYSANIDKMYIDEPVFLSDNKLIALYAVKDVVNVELWDYNKIITQELLNRGDIIVFPEQRYDKQYSLKISLKESSGSSAAAIRSEISRISN